MGYRPKIIEIIIIVIIMPGDFAWWMLLMANVWLTLWRLLKRKQIQGYCKLSQRSSKVFLIFSTRTKPGAQISFLTFASMTAKFLADGRSLT